MFDLTLIVLGLLGLWVGTEHALKGTVRLTEYYGLSQGFVGLTVLAIGTDLPELVVGLSGGIQQLRGIETSGVVVGNATGSAITQGSLVLGIAGLAAYLRLAPRMIRRDGLTLMLSAALFALVSLDGRIERVEGAALLIVYVIYFTALVQAERTAGKQAETGDAPLKLTALHIAGGLVAVVVSAHVVVVHAVSIAESWNVSQTLIGVLLIGAGTSLPELALSLAAATQGRASMSVGNIIGSNTFDLLVPVGASVLLHPVLVSSDTLLFDLPVLVLITVASLLFFIRRKGMQKTEAITLLAIYVVYAAVRIATE